MPDVVFEGFRVDQARAEAMADAVLATLAIASTLDVPAVDRLAALGIAAAKVIASTKLRSVPQVAAERLSAYIQAYLASRSDLGRP